ncbi:hypothetical protein GCM10027589_57670 [Actinocorallia lasiicapitis]
MRRSLALLLTASAVLVIPAPAEAAGPLTVHAAKAYGKPVISPGKITKVKIKTHVSGSNVTQVDVHVEQSAGRGSGTALRLKRVSGSAKDGVYEGLVELNSADWGGRYGIDVAVTNGRPTTADYGFLSFTDVAKFTVHRATKLAVKVPKKVTKGKKFLLQGTLTGFGPGGFGPLRKETVLVYFRPKGSKTYTKAATLRTNSKGRYSRRFTARGDGSIAAVYAGTQIWQKRVTAWKPIDVG